MQARARLFDVESFEANGKTLRKAVFVDLETMDKVSMLVKDGEAVELAQHKGKDGVLSVGVAPAGFNYSLRFNSFTKVAA